MAAGDELDIQIYLADGRQHAAVEDALAEMLDAWHIEVLSKDNPRFGSFWRRLTAKATAQTPSVEAIVEQTVRAVQMRALLWPQATIDAAQGDVLAKLITALGPEQSAVIQIGSILIVKANGNLMVRNLTQAELAYLERRPTLIKDPGSILLQLQDAASVVVRQSQELCSCGSGVWARECTCASPASAS